MGAPYVHPEGVHIISRDLFNTCARVREAHVAILAKINGQQAKISGRVLAKIKSINEFAGRMLQITYLKTVIPLYC